MCMLANPLMGSLTPLVHVYIHSLFPSLSPVASRQVENVSSLLLLIRSPGFSPFFPVILLPSYSYLSSDTEVLLPEYRCMVS